MSDYICTFLTCHW